MREDCPKEETSSTTTTSRVGSLNQSPRALSELNPDSSPTKSHSSSRPIYPSHLSSPPHTPEQTPSSRTTPRKLSKEEAKQIRQLGTSVLRVIHHLRSSNLTFASLSEIHPCSSVYHEKYHTRRNGREGFGIRSRYGRRGGMSTLAEVSETTSIV